MSDQVKLKYIQSACSFDSVIDLPLDKYQYSKGLITDALKFSYSICRNNEFLFYSVKTPLSNNFDPSLKIGEFKADLWRQDVVELFIAENKTNHSSSSSYQEFNISPSGAYWSARFNSYREKIEHSEQPISGLEIDRRIESDSLRLSIKIPLRSIIISDNFSEATRVNCCAIWNFEPKLFLSSCSLNHLKPDFHDIGRWSKIVVI